MSKKIKIVQEIKYFLIFLKKIITSNNIQNDGTYRIGESYSMGQKQQMKITFDILKEINFYERNIP